MVSKDATLTITFYMDMLLKILENNYQTKFWAVRPIGLWYYNDRENLWVKKNLAKPVVAMYVKIIDWSNQFHQQRRLVGVLVLSQSDGPAMICLACRPSGISGSWRPKQQRPFSLPKPTSADLAVNVWFARKDSHTATFGASKCKRKKKRANLEKPRDARLSRLVVSI
jgi:hypothetical protein